MATIRKHRGRWEVQVRRKGQPSASKSFAMRLDAEKWAREQELRADRGELARPVQMEGQFCDLIRRYRDEVSVKKRGGDVESQRLDALLRHKLARMSLEKLKRTDFAAYRDERLKKVSGSTVRRDLNLIRHIFKVASIEWGTWIRENPIDGISKPRSASPRTRRLRDNEFERLVAALDDARNPWLKPLVLFAIETGMRRGEMLALRWDDVDLAKQLALLRVTKNGHARVVPLSSRAMRIIVDLPSDRSEAVFPTTAEAIKLAWRRTSRRAGLEDLRLHDLRHEAISRFFERGLSIPEVAMISGHRDPRMLFRYTHLRATDLVTKLE